MLRLVHAYRIYEDNCVPQTVIWPLNWSKKRIGTDGKTIEQEMNRRRYTHIHRQNEVGSFSIDAQNAKSVSE